MFNQKVEIGVKELNNVKNPNSCMFGFLNKKSDISFFNLNLYFNSNKQKTTYIPRLKFLDNVFFYLVKFDCVYVLFLFLFFCLFLSMLRFSDFFKNANGKKLFLVLLNNSVSYYETVLFFCCFFFIFLFELFLSFISDEFGDTVILNVFLFTVLSIFLNFLGFSVLRFISLLSTTSSNFNNIRLFLTDVLNHGLCIVRIVMCALRYVLYDMQVELIDISLQYTDSLYFDLSYISDSYVKFFFYKLIFIIFDFFYLTISILINFFKYGIASFLLWLILDLFLLRVSVNKSEKSIDLLIFKKNIK